MSSPSGNSGDGYTLTDGRGAQARLKHMPPFVKDLLDAVGGFDIVARVPSFAVIACLRANPVMGGDNNGHVPGFASLTEGAWVL